MVARSRPMLLTSTLVISYWPPGTLGYSTVNVFAARSPSSGIWLLRKNVGESATIVRYRLSAFGSTCTRTRRLTGASACSGDTFMLMHSSALVAATAVARKNARGMSRNVLRCIWSLLSTTVPPAANSARVWIDAHAIVQPLGEPVVPRRDTSRGRDDRRAAV